MKVTVNYDQSKHNNAQLRIVAAYEGKEKKVTLSWNDKELKQAFISHPLSGSFTAAQGSTHSFQTESGDILVVGMGEKKAAKAEQIRRAIANAYKKVMSNSYKSASIEVASFNSVDSILAAQLIKESLELSAYTFDRYKTQDKSKTVLNNFSLFFSDKKKSKSIDKALTQVENITSSVNYTRDLVNEAPNVLHSVEYAKRVEKDAKKLTGVKVKILNRADLKKEKMDMFLSVNNGSAHEARLVHLTYTPKKATKKTRHVCLVGKGVTFDTGGYSLKPGASMAGMKFDMGGSATVYGAFRAAVLNNSPYKITCLLGMTDNAVNEHATMPDTIVTSRSGKTVEILNTDAEGRLVLGDCLDYACELNPDTIVDAATLTGACLVALGTEVCAILGNDDKTVKELLKSAKASDEYMWQLPIIPEWRNDMKSQIADLKNIGSTRFAGTATAAAFLENFIKNDIKWAHLDIAGVCDSQKHLPYCPAKGGSGVIVRTLHHYLMHGK